jgi:hypothetical protein
MLGHLGHVATDHFHNRLTPLSYFIFYRIWVRFDVEKISPGRLPPQSAGILSVQASLGTLMLAQNQAMN